MSSTATAAPARLLRLPAVIERTACSQSRVYEMIAKREFPAPIAIGPRARAWLESEISDWLAARIAARDEKSGKTRDGRHTRSTRGCDGDARPSR
jgi:predicted DNA-binding transcriptional regulator AlpA